MNMADDPDMNVVVDTLLEQIGQSAEKDDYDRAHRLEDYLHQKVLKAVVEGHPDAIELARKALTSHHIIFSRYYS
jgi:hypothetical protein